MSFSDWRSYAALVGWLIAVWFIVPIQSSWAQTPKDAGVTEARPALKSQGEAETDNRQQSPWKPPLPIRVIEEPSQAEHAQDREQKTDQHEADDLKAQRDAARAAERSSVAAEGQEWAAWATVGITFVGTGLLLLSLLFTYRALGIARDDANTARAAVAASERTAQRQLRAYINLESAHLVLGPKVFEGREVILDIVFRNFGSTPAHEVFVVPTVHIQGKPVPEFAEIHGSIGPSAPLKVKRQTFNFTDDMLSALRLAAPIISVRVSVRYLTVFSDEPAAIVETIAVIANAHPFYEKMGADHTEPIGFHMVPVGVDNRST